MSTPGKKGLRPPHAPDRVIDFTPHLSLPPNVPPCDYIAAMGGGWKMLGNGPDDSVFPGFTGAGVCAAARWANDRRMMTKLAGSEQYPGWDAVLEVYRTQNPDFDPHGSADTNGPESPADGGMDPQKLADYLVANGGPDGVKAICHGTVDPTNHEAVKAAIAIFGAIWVDILVFSDNNAEFANGQPWTASGSIEGGHAVLGGGEWPVKIETWADETTLTDQFWSAVEQGNAAIQAVRIVVWPEHLGTQQFEAGVDVAAVAEQFTALTGKPFPVPVPNPDPTPQPTPDPTPQPNPAPNPEPDGDDRLLGKIKAELRRLLNELEG